jgi:hypothetical protein
MGIMNSIAGFFGFGRKPNNAYTPQGFDRIASVYVTPGRDGVKRRWDGSSFDEPPRQQSGFDSRRRDFLPKNFGSPVFETPSGFRGIASAEMERAPEGVFRRKNDIRAARRNGLPTNDRDLGREE